MTLQKLHPDEAPIDEGLVRELLRTQFPGWENQDLILVLPEGTDNVLFRLGLNKVIRLPRKEGAVSALQKERDWLPRLSPHLPFEIPQVIGIGRPSENYPFPWLITNWIEGTPISPQTSLDFKKTANDLADFVVSLEKITIERAPESNRGESLISRDKAMRESIPSFEGMHNTKTLTRLWEEALDQPEWQGDPVWIHGDLHGGNLLAKNGHLTGVIDFGLSGIGDPACDLMPAWSILTKDTRDIFHTKIQSDPATWARGKGWALSLGVLAYPYYKDTNPQLSSIAMRTLKEVLTDLL